MTRRDYERLAQAFRDSYADAEPLSGLDEGLDVALANVADALEESYPNFNRQRFLAAATQTRKEGTIHD